MGDLVITASFEGGFDDANARLDGMTNRDNWIITKRPNCCPICRKNEDPFVIPLHDHCHCEAHYVP